jgi:hypothetical protein
VLIDCAIICGFKKPQSCFHDGGCILALGVGTLGWQGKEGKGEGGEMPRNPGSRCDGKDHMLLPCKVAPVLRVVLQPQR